MSFRKLSLQFCSAEQNGLCNVGRGNGIIRNVSVISFLNVGPVDKEMSF